MRLKAVFICLCLVLFAGCLPTSKNWMHPRVADPRKEDKMYETDTKFCQDKIGPQAKDPENDPAMAECLTRLGWKRKE